MTSPTAGAPERKSELWQRIRAARAHSKKTQGDIALVLGVSRPAVAMWESRHPDNRTRPTVEQMNMVARMCQVSPRWLMDDASDPDKVEPWELGVPNERATVDILRARATAFWYAVRYAVLSQAPELGEAFEHPIAAASRMNASFLHNKNLVGFIYDEGGRTPQEQDEMLYRQAGDLLLAETMLGYKCKKTIAVWTRTGRYDSMAAQELSRRGIACVSFNDIEKATDFLVATRGY